MRGLVLALVLLGLTSSTASAQVPAGPPGPEFYTPPSPLPGAHHGDVIWERGLSGSAALPGARTNRLVLYRTVGLEGGPEAVSGTVSIPNGRTPKGGWPVITWAHGTTGIADQCAPSQDTPTSSVHLYNAYAYPVLTRWLKAGFAVVRTDYEGLGTPGDHPYLSGVSEGRSTLDVVRAARQVEPKLSKKVVIAGHSQGGQAALWAGSLARHYTPDISVRGTIAFAPVSHLAQQARFLRTLSTTGGLTALASMIIRGVATAAPQLDVPSVLSDRGRELFPQTTERCLPDLGQSDSFGGLSPKEVFREDADINPLIAVLARSDAEQLRIPRPVRIVQGTADTTVLPLFTQGLVADYRRRRLSVAYRTYPGVDHGAIVNAGAAYATRLIARWVKPP